MTPVTLRLLLIAYQSPIDSKQSPFSISRAFWWLVDNGYLAPIKGSLRFMGPSPKGKEAIKLAVRASNLTADWEK